jgi:RimJ/RimL family protein N-acetyltransferase
MSVHLFFPASIATDRLLLRPPGPEDASALSEAVAESRSRLDPWMPWSRYYDDPIAASVYIATAGKQWAHGHELSFLILDRLTGELLGAIGLHDIHWDRRSFATGYWVRTSAEGQGYIREALRAIAKLVFTHLGGNRLWLTCDSRNDRSRHVAESTGMQMEAHVRNDARATDGSLRDTLLFGMLTADFQRLLTRWPEERFAIDVPEDGALPVPSDRDDEQPDVVLGVNFARPLQLESPRLLLRRPEIGDASELFALVERSRAHLDAWFTWTRRLRTPSDAEAACVKAITKWNERRAYEFLAFDRGSGEMIGGGNLHAFRWKVPSVEIDWWLDAAQTGKGFATEIGIAQLRFAVEAWRANRVEIWTEKRNLASRAVGRRVGFVEEGILRGDYPNADGIPANWAISSIIPAEYARLAPAFPAIRYETDG